MSDSPTVRDVDGRIVIDWPDPRPPTFEISSDLFEVMVEEINNSRSQHV